MRLEIKNVGDEAVTLPNGNELQPGEVCAVGDDIRFEQILSDAAPVAMPAAETLVTEPPSPDAMASDLETDPPADA